MAKHVPITPPRAGGRRAPAALPLGTAAIIPFPPRPASGSLLTPEMVKIAIEHAERVPQDELLGSAALLLQWSEKLAKPGTGVQSIHGALMAFLCLARALHVGVPVAEVVA